MEPLRQCCPARSISGWQSGSTCVDTGPTDELPYPTDKSLPRAMNKGAVTLNGARKRPFRLPPSQDVRGRLSPPERPSGSRDRGPKAAIPLSTTPSR